MNCRRSPARTEVPAQDLVLIMKPAWQRSCIWRTKNCHLGYQEQLPAVTCNRRVSLMPDWNWRNRFSRLRPVATWLCGGEKPIYSAVGIIHCLHLYLYEERISWPQNAIPGFFNKVKSGSWICLSLNLR